MHLLFYFAIIALGSCHRVTKRFLPSSTFGGLNAYSPQLSLLHSIVKTKGWSRILSVCPDSIFEPATHSISDKYASWNLNLDNDRIPVDDNYFDFAYSRHGFEKLMDPFKAFNELVRVSKSGYIETYAPAVEALLLGETATARGHLSHRFLFYTEHQTNTLWLLPKLPIIDMPPGVFWKSDEIMLIDQLSTNPPLWNNYYQWNETLRPRIKLYHYDDNYDLYDDSGDKGGYSDAIRNATEYSRNATIHYYATEVNSYIAKWVANGGHM